MRIAKLIVYLCAAVLLIIGIYSFIYAKDYSSGTVWTVMGILFVIFAYFRMR